MEIATHYVLKWIKRNVHAPLYSKFLRSITDKQVEFSRSARGVRLNPDKLYAHVLEVLKNENVAIIESKEHVEKGRMDGADPNIFDYEWIDRSELEQGTLPHYVDLNPKEEVYTPEPKPKLTRGFEIDIIDGEMLKGQFDVSRWIGEVFREAEGNGSKHIKFVATF